jgi:ATPase subunit of ABC transporter with duplicated ATPase domains
MHGLAHKPEDDQLSYRADIVLAPLGLDPDALMGHLSGGQLRRAVLA